MLIFMFVRITDFVFWVLEEDLLSCNGVYVASLSRNITHDIRKNTYFYVVVLLFLNRHNSTPRRLNCSPLFGS